MGISRIFTILLNQYGQNYIIQKQQNPLNMAHCLIKATSSSSQWLMEDKYQSTTSVKNRSILVIFGQRTINLANGRSDNIRKLERVKMNFSYLVVNKMNLFLIKCVLEKTSCFFFINVKSLFLFTYKKRGLISVTL